LEYARGAQAVPAGERDWRLWPCDSGLASPGVSLSLPRTQGRHARTVGDTATACWRGTGQWPRWPEDCEAAGEGRARHRRACKACVRAERRASCSLESSTLQSGVLIVGADVRRALGHAATMRPTAATGTPL